MAIILDGTTGLTAPAIEHLDTPAATDVGGTGLASPGASTNVLTSDGTVWYSGAGGGGGGGITAMTAQDVTGVSYVDFTGIPAGVKRISVMLYNVQSGAANLNINVGTSGGIVSTGYNSASMICNNSGGISNSSSTSTFLVLGNQVSVGNDWDGIFTLNNTDGYLWSIAGSANTYTAYVVTSGGRVDATAAVTTVRVALSSGSFVSGTVNVFYE